MNHLFPNLDTSVIRNPFSWALPQLSLLEICFELLLVYTLLTLMTVAPQQYYLLWQMMKMSRAVGEVPYEQKDHVSLCSNGEFNLNISCQQPAKAKEIMMDYNLITLHFLL